MFYRTMFKGGVNMKKIKPLTLPLITIICIISIYSFFNVSGSEIKNVKKLSEKCVVTIIVSNDNADKEHEYILNVEQKEKLKQLLLNAKYTRRMSNTIIGVLPENSYTVLADWNDNGKTNLYAKILGGEYIQFSKKSGVSNFMKINENEFEMQLKEIIEVP